MKKGLILTDCIERDRDGFLEAVQLKTGIIFKNIYVNSARWQKGISNVLRYLSYLFMPIYVFIIGKDYDYIISWQQFYGLFYAFWCNLFKLKKKKILIVMTFIYKKKNGIAGKLYESLINSIVRSGYIDAFICFSTDECDYYAELFGVDSQYFHACRLSVEDQYDEFSDSVKLGEYYLAAGRSNRDYDFLCKAFSQFPDRKLVIICDNYVNNECTNNIEIWNDIYGDEYLKYLAGCKAVIVPLNEDTEISSGQLVVIQSLMFGKVVIATDSKQMREYIEDRENGFLISNTTEKLDDILRRVESIDMTHMNKKARESYLASFACDHRSEVVAAILKHI